MKATWKTASLAAIMISGLCSQTAYAQCMDAKERAAHDMRLLQTQLMVGACNAVAAKILVNVRIIMNSSAAIAMIWPAMAMHWSGILSVVMAKTIKSCWISMSPALPMPCPRQFVQPRIFARKSPRSAHA